MSLSEKQLDEFVRHGYLVLRNMVPAEHVEAVRSRVLGEYVKKLALDTQGFRKPLGLGGNYKSAHEQDWALYRAGNLSNVVRALLGDYLEDDYSQILVWGQQEQWFDAVNGMHVDRPPRPKSGEVNKSTLWPSFALSIAVAIQGGDVIDSGSLGVYPGTHLAYEAYFKANPEATFWDQSQDSAGPAGYPEIEYPEVEQVLVQPGDVFLMHSMLAHTSMPNMQPTTRIALYFRRSNNARRDLGHEFNRSIWAAFSNEVQETARRLL